MRKDSLKIGSQLQNRDLSFSRVRVKICGITNREDALNAVASGVDALGFNTWPGTPRMIDLHGAAEWMRRLPPFISRVALLVNASLEEARAVAALPYIDAVQLHGSESPEYCQVLLESGKQVIKALRMKSESDVRGLQLYEGCRFLIDAHVPGQFGGTGVEADLKLVKLFCECYPGEPLILAGGLRPDNVGRIIRETRPYAVDTSSGVEAAPGKKSVELMRSFCAAVRDER